MSRNMICANGRILDYPLTGVQRYMGELLSRFGDRVSVCKPLTPIKSVRAHIWEQSVLPKRIGQSLLWSPSNTGPLSVANQVVTIHDVVPIDHPEWLSKRFALWYRFLIPRLASRVYGVITISEFTKNRLLEACRVSPQSIAVIPNGVDHRFCPQEGKLIESMLAVLKVPARHYVLALGSVEPRKNIPRLLEAWRRVASDVPKDVWLVIAGGQGAHHIYRGQQFGRLPQRVFFTGRVDDKFVPALYSGATLFVYPSIYEGFGLPPLEAMACGCAVITGNRTALPEVVGDAGLTIDPFDVDALAEAIRDLLGDNARRSELARQGVKRAGHFSWDRTATETERYLLSCANDI